ncbi:HAD domain-containing protein [Microbacterium sp. NPDC058342]|uniref:HAD domain-containing protein n=1 Tax=Microbacterium sp. NPDC058342 TaxID=3346454 RepID=UPI0036479FF5
MPPTEMPVRGEKPLLLLDVDGPLNPYRLITKKGFLEPKVKPGERRYQYERQEMYPRGWAGPGALTVLLSPDHGDELRQLAEVYDLVWATTWEHTANELIAPVLGLPELPVIRLPWSEMKRWGQHAHHSGSWKTCIIAGWLDAHAPGRPWVWIDDDITRADREWLHRHYGDHRGGPPALDRWLLDIHPSHGLREHDFEALRTWAATLQTLARGPVTPPCTARHEHIDYPTMAAFYEKVDLDRSAE